MKQIFYLCFCFSLLLLPKVILATDFITGFEDIPLMTDLHQIENQNFSFGNEESGYTEALLQSVRIKNFSDVKNYYKRILPQFGWTLKNESDKNAIFEREHNLLEFSFVQVKPLKILISLKSKN